MKTKKKPKTEKQKIPLELFHLETVVGEFMLYWGFKKIHGRIWTHLFISQSPLDSIELMERLKVSKGLMSLAIRDLLNYDVIKKDSVGSHGTTYYVANADLLGVITNVLRSRETKLLSEARRAGEALKKLNSQKLGAFGLSQEKIQTVINLTESAQTLLQTFLGNELLHYQGKPTRI